MLYISFHYLKAVVTSYFLGQDFTCKTSDQFEKNIHINKLIYISVAIISYKLTTFSLHICMNNDFPIVYTEYI